MNDRTPSVRLLVRLRREFPQVAALKDANIVRTRAGRYQRDAGAWRWEIHHSTLFPGVGSQYRLMDCLRANKLTITRGVLWDESDWYIDIDAAAAQKDGGNE